MRSTPANSDGNDDLSAWLDGELGEAEMAELEAELARDPALRAELAELEAVVRFVRDEAPVPAPDDFERRLAARIAAEQPEHAGFGARSAEGWSSWWRRPLGIPLEGWALTLAAAAALLIAWRVPALVGGVPDDGGERELSPAAVEPPSMPLRPDLGPDNPGAPSKDAPPEVIGRATTDPRAEAKKVASTRGIDAAPPVADGVVPDGAPDAVPAPSPGLELPLAQAVAPDGKPGGAPDGTADGGAADGGSLRYVVHAEDGKVKLELLKIAGRYGWSVVDSAGAIVSTGRMAGSTEDLVLSLPQADLARLDAELGAKGHRVEHVGGGDLVGGSHVRVRITLAVDAADPGVGAKKAVQVDESAEIRAPDAAAPTRR